MRRLASPERGGGERPGRDRRLAGADVALDQAQHRDGAGEVGGDLVDRDRLVVSEASRTRRACATATPRAPCGSARPWRRPPGSASVRAAPARPPPRDHAQLEREQLVEREPAQGRVSGASNVVG